MLKIKALIKKPFLANRALQPEVVSDDIHFQTMAACDTRLHFPCDRKQNRTIARNWAPPHHSSKKTQRTQRTVAWY